MSDAVSQTGLELPRLKGDAPATADLDERVHVEAALREGEGRFRAIAENIPQLAWIADHEGHVDWFNRGWLDYTGTTLEENLGVGWKAVHHPDYVDAVAEKFERHLREGRDWEDTFPLRGKDGNYRWFLSRMNVVRDKAGKIIRFFGTNTDVTDLRALEQELRASEERYRTLFVAAPMAVFVCDANAVIQHYNDQAETLWGRTPVCGVEQHCGSVKLWLPDGTLLPHTQSPILDVLRTGIPARNVEVLIERPDGSRLPVMVNFAALKNAEGKITGAITSFVDITERKRSEEQIAILGREAEHRAKNMLATVQATIRLTKADTPDGLKHAIEGRIHALANVHTLLVQSRWAGADLKSVVTQELLPYCQGEESRARIEGPNMALEPNTAQTIAMSVHELTTNAAKYGALSMPDGHVQVEWSRAADGRLVLCWTETGGPPVSPPTRRGFGTRVMEEMIRGQLRGEMRLDWRAEGLACEIVLPAGS